MSSNSLIHNAKIHSSWNNFFNSDIINKLDRIEQQIGTDYTPSTDLVLRFAQLDIEHINTVILGQDPYKPAGVANGRAFQPTNLTDWSQPFRQVSLKNIVRAIYAAYNNITVWGLIPSYKDIVYEMEIGKFKMKQPVEWFNSIEEQGVLLLNTSLTCKIGASNSHKEIWAKFTQELIKYIAKNAENKKDALNWFLWGNEAASYSPSIAQFNNNKMFISRHPMMCTQTSKDDFLYNTCFKDTKDIINWLG